MEQEGGRFPASYGGNNLFKRRLLLRRIRRRAVKRLLTARIVAAQGLNFMNSYQTCLFQFSRCFQLNALLLLVSFHEQQPCKISCSSLLWAGLRDKSASTVCSGVARTANTFQFLLKQAFVVRCFTIISRRSISRFMSAAVAGQPFQILISSKIAGRIKAEYFFFVQT